MPVRNPQPGDYEIAALYIGGFSHRGIAELCGLTIGKVCSRVCRMIHDGELKRRAQSDPRSFGELLREQRFEAERQRHLRRSQAAIDAAHARSAQKLFSTEQPAI